MPRHIPLILLLLVLAGCSGAAEDAREPAPSVAAGEELLLDVRTPGEYSTGHMPGAVNIPHYNLEDRLEEIAEYRDKPVTVYCESGVRSATARDILLEHGFTDVTNDKGGMRAYRDSH